VAATQPMAKMLTVGKDKKDTDTWMVRMGFAAAHERIKVAQVLRQGEDIDAHYIDDRAGGTPIVAGGSGASG